MREPIDGTDMLAFAAIGYVGGWVAVLATICFMLLALQVFKWMGLIK